MNKEEFWHILKTGFCYQTPKRRALPLLNLPGFPATIYYLKVFKVILTNDRMVRTGKFDKDKWADSSLDIIKAVESTGGRLRISASKGVANYNGPLVYIANHMSMLDTFILPVITLAFNNVTFVVKKSLFKYPFFGSVIKAINPIAVSRENPRDDLKLVLKKGKELISNGYSIVIFPQATRSAMFDASSFSSLGVKLARKAKVPVVPVALKTDFQANGKIIKEMGKINPQKTIYAKFGDPMPIEGNGQTTHNNVVEFITENLRAWGGAIR